MDFKDYCYFPILRTKDAELRAIENISSEIFSTILPSYELTKSRKTKKDPIGDIAKRMGQIKKIQGNRPFILDVTTDENQTNHQTDNLLLSPGGYEHWREFLDAYRQHLNIIPAIHIGEDDEYYSETSEFVRLSSEKFSHLALRLPTGLDDEIYTEVLEAISPHLGSCTLIVIMDSGCVRDEVKAYRLDDILDRIYESTYSVRDIVSHSEINSHIVCISGSFPLIVSKEGDDDYGEFNIYEDTIYRELSKDFPDIGFGDYASISPVQTDSKGGTFVPRIDFSKPQRFFYHRYRRDKGGYIKCAKAVLADPDYTSINCWGDEEISLAASSTPSGISPSFWISVRANRYMTQRAMIQKT